MRLVFAIFTLLIGCGAPADDWIISPIYFDPTKPPPVRREQPVSSIQRVVDEFESDCGSYGADLSNLERIEYIRYGNPATKNNPNRVGVCNSWRYAGSFYKGNIIIKRLDNEIIRKALLYHELGHCVLELGHTPQEELGMMAPIIHSPEHYKENWDELVKDLCKS